MWGKWFYFIEDTITNFSYDCRYHTNIKQRNERLLQTQEEFRHEELQEGPLTWKHLKLLNRCGISETFISIDIRGLESNTELRTILFKEGGIDTIMNSSQSNNKQREHNCIKVLIKPIEPPRTRPNKHTDHGLNEGDQLQYRISMNMESRQRQEGAQGSFSTDVRLNRKLIQCIQVIEQTEHESDDQSTLRTMKRRTWCTYEQGKLRDIIFRQETRSQDLEITWRTLTEPTKTTARSCAHQL